MQSQDHYSLQFSDAALMNEICFDEADAVLAANIKPEVGYHL